MIALDQAVASNTMEALRRIMAEIVAIAERMQQDDIRQRQRITAAKKRARAVTRAKASKRA